MGWFDRELKLICPDYFSMYNPGKRRWEMRRWVTEALGREQWSARERAKGSTFVRACRNERPCGQDIFDLQMGLYNARHAKELLRALDAENAALERAVDEEDRYQHRAAAKAIWRAVREPTVHLSGKALPWRSPTQTSPAL